MNFASDLFPIYLPWVAHLIYAAILGVAIWTAPWKRLKSNEQMHVFLGGCVLLLLIWSMKAGIHPGLTYHLLGATLFVLMFGWQLALIGLGVVLIGVIYYNGGDWQSFSINALVMDVLPVMLSYGLYRFAVRYLPHHFFVYVLVNGYLAGGLAMGITVLSSSALLVALGPYSLTSVVHDYLPFAPMMIFAEGFFSGMLTAGMALWRPEWIWTFDDARYLAGK